MFSDADRANSRSTSTVGAKRMSEIVNSQTNENAYIANVLCKFMWHTSPPHVAGFVTPIWAFKFAPSK